MQSAKPPTLNSALARISSPRGHLLVACVLSVSVGLVAVALGPRAAGGADEYGYVSQAELWLNGALKTDQSFLSGAPWPGAAWAFSPLGYRPDPLDGRLLVPVYSPGLPILLAAAKALAGQTAMFFVVPIFTSLLVCGTYLVGLRLASSSVAALGAWLTATSPVVLFMSMSTMTDVPVAAVWTWAIYFLLGSTLRSAAAAGLLAGFALLIRPNLAPLGLALGALYMFRLRDRTARTGPPARQPRWGPRTTALRSALAYAIAALPAIAAVALVNRYLYGDALRSGYSVGSGHLSDLFLVENLSTNLRLYLGWLVEAHTPFVLAGFLALFVPLRRFWPAASDRRVFAVIGAFVVSLWTIYCAWGVFDAWWFCRYLLPSWPFIMLGVAAVTMALASMAPRGLRPWLVAGVVAIGVFQIHFANAHNAFLIGRDQARYAAAAQVVRASTPRNSVVLAWNHSGSLRYYAGRMTINIENVDGGLDEIVDWLAGHGVRAYAALEEFEVAEFERRFAGARRLGALSQPIAIYENPGKVQIFDLSSSGGAAGAPTIVRGFGVHWRAPGPTPPPRLVLR